MRLALGVPDGCGHTIRDCIADVTALRLDCAGEPMLGATVARTKTLQVRRFAGTYADRMESSTLGPAALFFLQALYSERDHSERDAQFGRIADTLQTMFPAAPGWPHRARPAMPHAASPRGVGQRHAREQPLEPVLAMGRDLHD